MIKFKEKRYIAPLLAAVGGPIGLGLMGGNTVISAIQGHKQNKEIEAQGQANKEAMDRQAELIKQQNRKLEKIADNVKDNPAAVGDLPGILQNRAYSFHPLSLVTRVKDLIKKPSLYEKSKRLVKSVGKSAKNAYSGAALDNVGMGAALGVTALAAGSYINRDMEKNGMDIDPETGKLKFKNYSEEKYLKNSGGAATSKIAGGAKMGVLFGGAPTIAGYLTEKKRLKDQIKNTVDIPVQREYSWSSMASLVLSAGKRSIKDIPIVKHPAQTITGGISFLSSLGMTGTKNNQAFAKSMRDYGSRYNSKWAKSAGKWMKKNPIYTNMISTVPGLTIGAATCEIPERLVNKVGKKINPDAYRYKEAKDKAIE